MFGDTCVTDAHYVVDSIGIVLGFSLVRSESYEDGLSQKLLKHINRNNTVTLIAVDNCCHVRSKLVSILGQVRVVLDVFHALQRVTIHEKSCDFTSGRKEVFNRK